MAAITISRLIKCISRHQHGWTMSFQWNQTNFMPRQMSTINHTIWILINHISRDMIGQSIHHWVSLHWNALPVRIEEQTNPNKPKRNLKSQQVCTFNSKPIKRSHKYLLFSKISRKSQMRNMRWCLVGIPLRHLHMRGVQAVFHAQYEKQHKAKVQKLRDQKLRDHTCQPLGLHRVSFQKMHRFR